MRRSTGALGATFIGAGALHFARPEMYEAIMPDWLPAHRGLVLASGVAEIAGGVTALVPQTRPVSRWLLIATLLGVFPANLHMALHPERFRKVPPWALWARLPLQAGFMAWTWKGTQPG